MSLTQTLRASFATGRNVSKGQSKMSIGGAFGALLFVLVAVRFIDPVSTAVNDATANLSGAEEALTGLITLIFVVGIVYGTAAYFGLV